MELKYLLFFQLAVGQEFPGFPGQGGPDNPYNIRPGQCPELPNQPNFQVDRYTGVWETVTTDDEENIPFGSECVTATYAKIAPNKISVNNSTPILPGTIFNDIFTLYIGRMISKSLLRSTWYLNMGMGISSYCR